MVKLEEVIDEEFLKAQEGPQDDEDWDTDSGMLPSTLAVSP
jgi:import receptor subunit TOM22